MFHTLDCFVLILEAAVALLHFKDLHCEGTKPYLEQFFRWLLVVLQVKK